MATTTYSRGNKLIFIDGVWKHEDGSIYDDSRPCAACNKMPTPEGYDPCLGYIEGAKHACCGHGREEGYVVYE